MAIVRTTNKETNTSGTTPPRTEPANGKAARDGKLVARATAGAEGKRAPSPGRAVSRTSTRPERGRPVPANAASRAPLATQPSDPRSFLRDTWAELHRVTWPSREAVSSGTIVTILLLVFFALYIFALNIGIEWLLGALRLLPEAKV